MADDYYDAPPVYYNTLDLSQLQPIVLVDGNPFATNPHLSLPSQYASPQSHYTCPTFDLSSQLGANDSYVSPAYQDDTRSASFSGGRKSSLIPQISHANSDGDDIVIGTLNPETRAGASQYPPDEFGCFGKAETVSWNLIMRHRELLKDAFYPGQRLVVDTTKRGPRVSFKCELGSDNRYANVLLSEKVYDSDFNIGSAIYSMPLADLDNAVIGVEATAYLKQMIEEPPAHEPLLAALGGDPIGLKYHIESELDKWKEHGMTPIFVFEGQSVVGKDDMTLRIARAALQRTESAWARYAENKPDEAVKAFGASGAIRPQDLYRILQEVLAERKLDFIVAPFSACAQLAYMDSLEANYIDGVMGSKELLLYDKAGDAIINPPTAADWEKKAFTGIVKPELLAHLKISSDMFADALLMVGTSFLPPFPPLQVESIISVQPYTLVDAINLLRTSEKSITSTCSAFRDILDKQDPKWLDKYRKAKMLVKHCVTVEESGRINVRDYDNLTSDNIDYLGLQLPAELYHYLSKALIGPRIMNSFVSLESIVFPTLDGVVSDEYKHLVTRELVKLKEESAALIASRIHRGYQYKDINTKFWFDDNLNVGLTHRNMHTKLNALTDAWLVQDADLKAQEKTVDVPPGTISFAALALQSKDFATSTLKGEKVAPLNSKPEILSNALWRLFHLRKFVSDQHELTSWGKALATTLKAISPEVQKHGNVHHIEEAAFLAFELIRFNNLNAGNRHTELIGGPLRGSDSDKSNCLLIGRTSCLLKLRHANIGYTGPLSKNFLAFHSLIKAVRETDRDLLEAIAASMFLSNQANRLGRDGKVRDDFGDLGRSLPFAKDVDLSLGIAVKTYLDDFLKLEWTSREREANKSTYVERYLPHSLKFKEDLEVAFRFFDAVYEGVMTLGDEIKKEDKAAWVDAKAYLDARR